MFTLKSVSSLRLLKIKGESEFTLDTQSCAREINKTGFLLAWDLMFEINTAQLNFTKLSEHKFVKWRCCIPLENQPHWLGNVCSRGSQDWVWWVLSGWITDDVGDLPSP